MGLLFNFDRLLGKYSADCQLLRGSSGGKYESGNWIPETGPEPEPVTGAVIPMTNRKIYQSGGTYTEQDREFITTKEIPLESAVSLIYHADRYEVQENTDYSDYAGFYTYNLKRVSAFDRAGKN